MVQESMEFIRQYDPEIGGIMLKELERQRRNLELIASENIVTEPVMAAMVSLSPPTEIALRIASSKPVLSKKAESAAGMVPSQVTSKE